MIASAAITLAAVKLSSSLLLVTTFLALYNLKRILVIKEWEINIICKQAPGVK